MTIYPCPAPHCLRMLKGRSGYTKHLRTCHPGWGESDLPSLQPVDYDSDSENEDDNDIHHTPLQRRRTFATELLTSGRPITYVFAVVQYSHANAQLFQVPRRFPRASPV